MSQQDSQQNSHLQRNKIITVVVCIAFIILAMIVGALGVALGGPNTVFPESGFAQPQHFAALLTQVGTLL